MDKKIKQLNDTTYKVILKDDWKDRVEIEIGDSKQPDFKPQVKIERWDNEANFSVRMSDLDGGVAKQQGERINYQKGDIEIDFFETENAFKFDYIIKKKPQINKLIFSIQSKNVDFFYQPELTQKEIDDGCLRPENVVGSYAVYMTNPGTNWVGGKEYKVGKVAHIYRPHLYDSNGLEAWGNLHIENGIYEVTIPQDFLDKAVFPIKSNDTFGYESVGGSDLGLTDDRAYMFVGDHSLPGYDGTVSDINVYIRNGSGTRNHCIKGVLFDSDSGNIITNGIGNEQCTGSGTYVKLTSTFSTNPTIYSATGYGPGIVPNEDGAYMLMAYDDSGSNESIYDVSNNYASPQNMGGRYADNKKYSIYATYAPAATGTNMQLNIGDTFKEVSGVQINIGDTWKEVTGAQINIGDTWKTIF